MFLQNHSEVQIFVGRDNATKSANERLQWSW